MKKYVKAASVDHSEDSKYQQIFADVVDQIIDHIAGDGMINVYDMEKRVKGYNPDWCNDNIDDKQHAKVMELTRKLAMTIAEDYFFYYDQFQ